LKLHKTKRDNPLLRTEEEGGRLHRRHKTGVGRMKERAKDAGLCGSPTFGV